jgi:precorrin-3B C17-methyltransferase
MFSVRSRESEFTGGGRTSRATGGDQDQDHSAENSVQPGDRSNRQGKLFVVGIGPGGKEGRTHQAENAINQSDVIFGYTRYIELASDLLGNKEVIASGMRQEVDRCLAAIEKAETGKTVAMLSSGDPGVYGMAGLILELANEKGCQFPIDIIAGVSAANAAAASLGAPLMCDYACISLSDLLVPWEQIKRRLEKVAEADLVTALYNPKSKKRVKQLKEAADIFRQYRSPQTPVGVGTSVGTEEEHTIISDLDRFLDLDIGMRSIVIIGNSTSRVYDNIFITQRGYKL